MRRVQQRRRAGFLILACSSVFAVLAVHPANAQPSGETTTDASPVVATPVTASEPARPSTATLIATVQSLNGQLEVQRPGSFTANALAERAALYPADVANTGESSKATLLFNEGSQLHVNSNSLVELTTPKQVGGNRRSFFKVIRGEVFLKAVSSLAVLTPSATAAVRGTAFNLSVDAQGTTRLTVTEGVVDFFNPFGAVIVRAGEESVARVGQAPTTPVPVATTLLTFWTAPLERVLQNRPTGGQSGDVPATGQSPVVTATLTPTTPRKRNFWKTQGLGILAAVVIGTLVADQMDEPERFLD